MISPENKFQCSFRTLGSNQLEISTTFQIQQDKINPEDWNIFLEIFIEKVQAAISTIETLKAQKPRHQMLKTGEKRILTLYLSGLPRHEIADELGISLDQVIHQKKKIDKKMVSPLGKSPGHNSSVEADDSSVRNEKLSAAAGHLELTINGKTNHHASYEERFMDKVMTILENHRSNSAFNTRVFSNEVCMSRSQLHRKLKAITGYTTGGLIRSYRLRYARKLIHKKFGNMAQIAYECGFNNPSYFAECFKRQFGMLPSEYSKTTKTGGRVSP